MDIELPSNNVIDYGAASCRSDVYLYEIGPNPPFIMHNTLSLRKSSKERPCSLITVSTQSRSFTNFSSKVSIRSDSQPIRELKSPIKQKQSLLS